MSIIELNYISPMTDYIFSKLDKYYLVISFMNSTKSITIYKCEIVFDNVTETVRAYHISKCINVDFPIDKIKYNVQIFKHDKSNVISLLFTNLIDFTAFEYNNIQPISLYCPDTTFGYKNTMYVNTGSFLSEQFFNFETLMPKNQCILFMTLKKHTQFQILEPVKIDVSTLQVSSYNKYKGIYMIPMKQVLVNNYVDFLKYYMIDVTKYVPKMNSNFKDMLMRKIDMSKRPITYNVYDNNVLVCPSDCRLKIIDDNSFSCFMRQNDYPRYHMPYQVYLVGVKSKKINGNECLILNFTNSYFIPKSIGEREYSSVVYGQAVQVSRGYQELMDIQPNTTLQFDIIFIGSTDKESIIMTNEKLRNYKGKIWMNQSEEIVMFNNALGQCIVSFNRKIEFDSDIKYNVENYVKLNDTIGYIQ